MPFTAFANRVDPDQAALVRAVRLGSTTFAYENIIIISDPTHVNPTSLCSLHQRDQMKFA